MNSDNLIREILIVNYCLSNIFMIKLYGHLRKETMMSDNNYDFEALNKINVDKHVQQKGRFNYVSWADIWTLFLKQDKDAVFCYNVPQEYNETVMVSVTVQAFGKTLTEQLPVLLNNRAIKKPDAMAINTAQKRCLAKCVSLFGLGLYVYRGEDLFSLSIEDQITEAYEDGGMEGLKKVFNQMTAKERKEALPFINKIKKDEEKDGTENG